MNLLALGQAVVIADKGGDYPALVSKVLTAKCANVIAFPDGAQPTPLKGVQVFSSRVEAVGAHLKDGGEHAYWPAKP